MKIDNKLENKINITNLIKSYINKDLVKLKEGTVLTAKIVDIFEGKVLLDLGKGNYITGTTELNLRGYKNSMISFLVKSIENNVAEIKPLLDNMNFNNTGERPIYNELDLAKEILELYSIDQKEVNIKVIEAMLKFKMPLNKDNVLKFIKYINKLDFLIKATDDELYHLLNTNQDLLNSDISKIIIKKESHLNLPDKNIESFFQYSKSNVQNFIQEIKHVAIHGNLTSNMIKQVIFLNKHNIDISINNIKHFMELIDKNNIIEDKINSIIDTLPEESFLDKSLLLNLKNNSGIKITFTQKDKDNINNYYNEFRYTLDLIKERISSKSISNDLQENLKELDNIIKLINKLNNNLTFLYVPFTLKDDNIKNTLYILNNNKKAKLKTTDKLSAFIKLDTKNFSTIEVMCVLIKNSLNISFKVEEQFIGFFEENKALLINTLCSKGFSKVDVNINEQFKNSILDILIDEGYMNYKLNIKV